MSVERRHELVELAVKYDIPLIDDNPYGEIRFTGTPVPSLKAIGGDAVISLGTFSKTLAPGLRIAWVNAPKLITSIFEKVKQCTDLHTNTFTQYMIYSFLNAGKLDNHIKRLVKNYGDKRNLMLQEMENHFPEGMKWTKPEGGLFLWVELPNKMSSSQLFQKAIEQKVAYVHGKPFYPHGENDNTLRLNFSNATHETISEGIRRLAKVIKDNMA